MGPNSKATLTKHRVREILQSIESGQPVSPAAELWTVADCLTVAGILLSSAMLSGARARLAQQPAEKPEQRLREYQAAIEFVAAMATAHHNSTWDEYFEPAVTVGIAAGRCTPLSGLKR